MSGWERTHRRYRLVYAVADDIVRRGAAAKENWAAAIDAEFGSVESFLLDVRRRWFLAIDARTDYAPMPEIEATVARENKPLAALIDAFAEHPVLAGVRGTRRLRAAAETA